MIGRIQTFDDQRVPVRLKYYKTPKSESQPTKMPRKSNTEKSMIVSTGAAAAAPARRKSSSLKRPTAAVEVVQPVPVAAEPTQEDIARLAYLYWEARGCQGGSAEEDWLRAEQELRGVIR
jgi:hypothetical protein